MILAARADFGQVLFRPLSDSDAPGLAALLLSQRADYMKDFFPFRFDAETIEGILRRAHEDRFWGIEVDGALAGLCMLRGFDEGYSRPSFGLMVAEDCAGRGLGSRALQHALAWCRQRGVSEVMLKVAADNSAALAIYRRAGFVPVERCDNSGHWIHVLSLGAV